MKFALLIASYVSLLFAYIMLFFSRSSKKYKKVSDNSIFRKIFCFNSNKIFMRFHLFLVISLIIEVFIVTALYLIDYFFPFISQTISVIFAVIVMIFTLIYSAIGNILVELNITYGKDEIEELPKAMNLMKQNAKQKAKKDEFKK